MPRTGARPALAALAGLGLLVSFTSTSAQWHGTAEVGGTITTGTWVAGEELGGGEPADLDDEESVPAPAADTADTPGLTEEDLD